MGDIEKAVRPAAIIAGPVAAIFVLLLPTPAGLPFQAHATAAVAVLMAIWWMSEAVPLAITALLPLVLFPPLGIASVEITARSYAHPLIFLFLGGFLLARAMQRWKLNLRVALAILRLSGTRPAGVVAGIMAATAFLSMWVSNTATAMMMLPIGEAIARAFRGDAERGPDRQGSDFSAALMLGVAYGATIGGMGTLIGTPANALFAGFMANSFGIDIGFTRWMLVGVPAVLLLLPIAWLILTRISFHLAPDLPAPHREGLKAHLGDLGPMEPGERRVALLLAIAALAWTTRPLLEALMPELALSDAGIAITMAMMLFVVPADGSVMRAVSFWRRDRLAERPLLTWSEAAGIRWDVLILFGGGLTLANMIGLTGLAAWIAGQATALADLPWILVICGVAAAVIFLGELASNTAMAAIFLPIAAAAAFGLGVDPVLLALVVTLSASLGFMLPVATPPNAIVYGSGAVTIAQMVRAGLLLNLAGIAVVALLASMVAAGLFAWLPF